MLRVACCVCFHGYAIRNTLDGEDKLEDEKETKKEDWEPKIVVFLCNWCAYAAAELAGVGRFQYSSNVRVIRVPCVGKVNPLFIVKALQEGVDGVLVFGCLPGDCHYISGNYVAEKRFAVLNSILEFVGVEKERVQITWISAAEGERFSQVIKEATDTIKALGPSKRFTKQKME